MAVLWLWFLSFFFFFSFFFSSQLCNEHSPCFTSPAFQTARAPTHTHADWCFPHLHPFSFHSQYMSTFILPVSLSTLMICAYSQVLVTGSGWGAQPQSLQWNKSVLGLFASVQKSELQMLPFEISFHLWVEPWAPAFVLYFTILFTSYLFCLLKVLLTMQGEDLYLSVRWKKVNVEQ